MRALTTWIETHFLALALGLSGLALWRPELFTWLAPYLPQGLGLIMFGMGLTLTFADFRRVLVHWRLVLLGTALHYAIMPLAALAAAWILALPQPLAVGLAVVGACPSGTASSVAVYLAGANVPLAVSVTLASTLLAPLATPAILWLLLGARVDVSFPAMVGSVFWIVAFPLFDGLVLRQILKRRAERVAWLFPGLSVLIISLVIACIVGLNRAALLQWPVRAFAAVVLHNGLGLGLGWLGARAFGCAQAEARTLALEVGMQNSGLGAALAAQYFGAASALPSAIFSLWHNVSGVTLARRWARNRS